MANQSGSVYGLTILSPIINDPHAHISHDLHLRMYLGGLPRNQECPFAKVTSTHMCRLTVMNDVVFVGSPAVEEHLKSQYLVFESNFDGDLDSHLAAMVNEIPECVDKVWSHCVGYPGIASVKAFQDYMKKCQLTTTFYFADVNNKTVSQTLRALQTQEAVAAFIEAHQGKSSEEVQQVFAAFIQALKEAPESLRGSGWNGLHHRYQTAT